ncbi:aldo/keto reductase [Gloeocapsopsis crepidinum LEGE 06123]|uniref:Aldo/keto reductase n=1 Tax=Gloeocapsopsis crepidinum LEGE 06123 TaxID=588587 RepID=A0ABR9UTK4_9CHRO|nr:aldo/keto reductase [Gloeocapsopsis crepidinum]MBE9191617.1 aldo/keto reductase [Gloeocapsopsis crepidinum LEGE 06123]
MQYRRFGRTNIQMPVFSCGGMRYQFKWQDVPAWQIPRNNQKNLEATIRKAVEVGINHIETARGYGTSEYQLGKILPTLPREQIIVQTKINPTDNTREFQQKFEQSLKNLRLDYVDLLAIHGINDPESLQQSVRFGGCVEVLQKLQAQGKVRFLGFSTHGPTDIIVDAIATNLFDYVNLHWYYINQNNWVAIEAANRHDMGVFIISPSDKGGMLYKPPQKLVDLCAPLSPIVFNNLFCLSHSQVHTLSVGAARPQDFDEHLKTFALLGSADETLPPILARLEQAAIASLGESWAKTWHVGLPKHSETPGDVNIPVILWLRNLAIAYDMIEYAKMRYNLLGNGGSWFPGANAAKINQLNLQNCLNNSPHAADIPTILQEAHQLLSGAAIKRLSQE